MSVSQVLDGLSLRQRLILLCLITFPMVVRWRCSSFISCSAAFRRYPTHRAANERKPSYRDVSTTKVLETVIRQIKGSVRMSPWPVYSLTSNKEIIANSQAVNCFEGIVSLLWPRFTSITKKWLWVFRGPAEIDRRIQVHFEKNKYHGNESGCRTGCIVIIMTCFVL